MALAEQTLTTLRDFRAAIQAAVEVLPGEVCFFYCDEPHRIVGIRIGPSAWLGEPNVGGVFNHGLVGRSNRPDRLFDPGSLLVVCDEVTALQLQSACFRVALSHDHHGDSGYIEVCAVNPSRVDVGALRALCRTPIIALPTGPQGPTMIQQLREAVNFRGFEFPEPNLSCTTDTETLKRLAKLIAESTRYPRTFASVRGEIDEVRSLEGKVLKPYEVNRIGSRILATDLAERGTIYHDGRLAYTYSDQTKQVIPVDGDSPDFRLLASEYGIGGRDTMFKPMMSALDIAGRKFGTHSEVHTLAHYNRERSALYVFDFDRWVHRITPSGVQRVDNGTDGVLFVSNAKWKPWTLLDTVPTHLDLAETLMGAIRFTETTLTRASIQFLILVWMFAMFFRELFPTRVICAPIGPKGSGKTTLLESIGRLLFGANFKVTDISDDSKDLDAAITTEPLVVIDNADRKLKWLDDKLAIAATGGSIKRRDLYTTNRLVELDRHDRRL